MKYIFLGLPTYISDRILSICASVFKPKGEYASFGNASLLLSDMMALKHLIKENSHDVFYLSQFPVRGIPALENIPPGDFDYKFIYLEYDLHDYILFKTIEQLSADVISAQSINNYILNNTTTIKKLKDEYNVVNNFGDFDLSYLSKVNIGQCMKNKANILAEALKLSPDNFIHAINENSPNTNPTFKSKYNISEHYFNSISDVVLSDNTLAHILVL